MAALLELRDRSGLVAGQHLGHDFARIRVEPQTPRHRISRALVVARNHHAAHALGTQIHQRFLCTRLGLVTKRQQGDRCKAAGASFGHGRYRGTLFLQIARHGPQIAQIDIQLLHPAQTADQETAPRHLALGSATGHGAHTIRLRHGDAALLGRVHHGARQRVFAAALHARHRSEDSGLGQGWFHVKRYQSWLSHGQRAGLVERHGIDLVRHFQRLGVLDQNAVLGGHARPGHDRGGRRQPQRARAGNHQHRHGVDQRFLQPRAHCHPADEGDERDHQHDGHEDRRHLVHQPLNRRLGRLRVFHEANDAREHRLRAHGRDLHDDAPIAVDRAARERRTRLAHDRQRLAGQHGFIDLRVAFDDHAIHRNALAGAHDQLVAGHHLGNRHIDLSIATDQMRHVGPQRMQRADRRRGLALGACLQPFAQQHQRDHHRRRLEVQMRRVARMRREPQPERQPEARARADRHQQIHVARQRLERMPARLVEARTEDELHRRGQHELRPRRQHPVLAEQIAEHRQHQRRGQQQANRHRHETRPGRSG